MPVYYRSGVAWLGSAAIGAPYVERSCTDVQLISDIAKTMFKKKDVDELNLTLKEKKSEVEKIKMSRETLLEELKESETNALNAIKAYMETILLHLETESIKEVEKEFKTMETMLLDEIQISENQLKSLSNSADDIKQSDGNKAQQFVSMKTTQKRLSHAEDILNNLDTRVQAKVSFAADQTVLEFLQQLKTFGSFIRNTVYSVKGTREMNIKVQSDSYVCYVYGSCLTEDGKLQIPDYSNKRLKRADIVKLSVVDYCDLPHNPHDVCSIDKHGAIVTLENHTIQFVSLKGDKMTLTRGIKLNHRCFCIAYRNNKLYISDNSMSVYVHDMRGTLLQTISKDSSGKDLFERSRHIAFSDCGDGNGFKETSLLFEIIPIKHEVTSHRNFIVTVDGHGNNCKIFSGSDLNNATGVCTDGRGNLCVCGQSLNNVSQLGQNGTKMGIVIKSSKGLNQPWSLAFDVRTRTLCVMQLSKNTVKLFDLH